MKTVLLGVVAALALTSLPVVHAQDSSVSIQAPRAYSYHYQGEEFRPYRNTYLLEDGQKIAFSQRYNTIKAVLADGSSVRIYATSPTTFVSDAGVSFTFQADGDGLTITNYNKLPLAGNAAAKPIMMAARR